MINELFYQNFSLNTVTTKTTKRFIFRVIQKYFYRIYDVNHCLIIFKILHMMMKNNNVTVQKNQHRNCYQFD